MTSDPDNARPPRWWEYVIYYLVERGLWMVPAAVAGSLIGLWWVYWRR